MSFLSKVTGFTIFKSYLVNRVSDDTGMYDRIQCEARSICGTVAGNPGFLFGHCSQNNQFCTRRTVLHRIWEVK